MGEIPITELVGKRCLLKVVQGFHVSSPPTEEYKVLEVSPSGTWVRLMNIHGNKYWKPIQDIALVEILKDLKAEKPKDPQAQAEEYGVRGIEITV